MYVLWYMMHQDDRSVNTFNPTSEGMLPRRQYRSRQIGAREMGTGPLTAEFGGDPKVFVT